MAQNEMQDISIQFQQLQQDLQGIMYQKEAMRMHSQEIQGSLKELASAKSEVFKAVGAVLIKSDKETLIKELNDEKELIEVRSKSIERQEKTIRDKLVSVQEKLMKMHAARSGIAVPGSTAK